MKFTEEKLEQAFIELLGNEGELQNKFAQIVEKTEALKAQ